ncbi:MAG: helix-turn-helix domain-containing protein [Alistipes sp.]|nr:helix-turn-helix domain-containing protein [Alistipes sp.]
MTKLKQQRQGLPPLDLRVQDHYEELLTVSQVAKLSGFSKQFIYQLIKSNTLCYRTLEGVAYIKYRHLRAWFTKLPSNKDCPLCPASFSLAGLMNYTKMGRSWVLHFVERHNVRSYYLGNSRRFNYEDCVAAWEVEQAKNPEWITIEGAIEEFAITREILLSTTESKIVRIKCKDAKVLVNVLDIKQLKDLKQWEEL